MWGLWPRCFVYRPQCWKTGTRNLSHFFFVCVCVWKVLTFLLSFVNMLESTQLQDKEKRLRWPGFPTECRKDMLYFVHHVSLVTSSSAIVKHWLTNLHPTHTEKFNKLFSNNLHCTIIPFCSACWCQGFKTLFSVLFSLFCLFFSVISVLC